MEQRIERIKLTALHERIVSAEQAASWVTDGMAIGLSGFTRAGDAKAVPNALAKRREQERFQIDVYTGASLGSGIDGRFAQAGIVRKRAPYQSDPVMRSAINSGEVQFVDHHLSQTAEWVRGGVTGPLDFAIIEALGITQEGLIIPTTSVGNSMVFTRHAKQVIIEINTAQPLELEGLHDCYEAEALGKRQPIPLVSPRNRIGSNGIRVDPSKVKGIVWTNQADSPSPIDPPDEETDIMAGHLLRFLRGEVQAGRLSKSLPPLQSGVGSVANAVLHGLINSEFDGLELYSEVLQDAVFDLLDSGKAVFASASAITLSEPYMERIYQNFGRYRDRLVLRPQEISNHPEIIRRLGLISINTALEFDLYGNVNSTHIAGTKMMNGIGGSGDFGRNAQLAIFVTKSTTKNGRISCVVPFASHIDHTEHDVDVLVTEHGFADIRNLAPRERAERIIANCVHPDYRSQLQDYFNEAIAQGGHTPHILDEALSWHARYMRTGTMLKKSP
ncbi:acetyl-CoA hydrolase/transferase family protein [Planococcus sp. CP5-4]|uniref:acetyl-CoA hydrolase/transferase family protein n=1 Tax=unclassified Planococcus (in: firmicutes) TaxID=2662419 RepID=UPI001C231094|nr:MULTISPECIES: acetyl-CoA hydrolase/transferase family protein [unclassified Planococcus (in: firmicutes)]MBU9673281.1 acetyl-CoA hydrolase/transferase family protein [Planococcus sp. CP5-4_YE]MBV0908375.1 acetyl-CoA hydrolase/transferase family protein [Planococcus sp. CP5-4_UN]MBW6062589.1 acetyl-CoA hydrolase/transferase family protein [Planococcus sp. CP5-4]